MRPTKWFLFQNFYFYKQDKNRARHFEQEDFFSRILIRSIQKKNQVDVFWEFDFEKTCKKSRKNLVVRIS